MLEAGPDGRASATRRRSPTTARRSSSAGSRAAARRRAARRATRSSSARCSSIDTETGDEVARAAAPAPPDRPRELHLAQLQHRADQGRQLPGLGQLPGRHHRASTSRTRTAPQVIALRRPDAAAEDPDRRRSGRRRLVDLLVQRQDLRVRHLPRHDGVGPRQHLHEPREHGRRCRTRRRRSASIAADNAKPTITIAAPLAGGQFLQNSRRPRTSAARTRASGVESCVGTVADGANVDTSDDRLPHVHGHRDRQGRQRHDAVGRVRGQQHRGRARPRARTVPATLSLTLGTPATFGAFTPGVARDVHREHDRERDLDRR